MKRSRRATVLFIVAALAGAAMLGSAVLMARGADVPTAPAGQHQPPTLNVAGTVESFNFAPRGEIEGIILGSASGDVASKTVQVNFPPQIGSIVRQTVNVGDAIKVVVRRHQGPGPREGDREQPGRGRPDDASRDASDTHPAFEFVSLTDAKGKTLAAPRPDDRKAVHIEGKVKALNFDRQGQPNGAQLESGEIVLLGPGKAKTLALAPGSKLTVDGITLPSPTGIQAIEAHTVNGILVKDVDGPRREGRREGPPQNERPQADGPRREGERPEGKRPDGPRPEGRPPEGPRGEGARPEGPREQPPRPDGPDPR